MPNALFTLQPAASSVLHRHLVKLGVVTVLRRESDVVLVVDGQVRAVVSLDGHLPVRMLHVVLRVLVVVVLQQSDLTSGVDRDVLACKGGSIHTTAAR